jgi:hypothetical protein
VEILAQAVPEDLSLAFVTQSSSQLTLLEDSSNTKDILFIAELEFGLISLYILDHLLYTSLSTTDTVDTFGIET